MRTRRCLFHYDRCYRNNYANIFSWCLHLKSFQSCSNCNLLVLLSCFLQKISLLFFTISRWLIIFLSTFYLLSLLDASKFQVSKDIKYADKQPIVPWGPRYIYWYIWWISFLDLMHSMYDVSTKSWDHNLYYIKTVLTVFFLGCWCRYILLLLIIICFQIHKVLCTRYAHQPSNICCICK